MTNATITNIGEMLFRLDSPTPLKDEREVSRLVFELHGSGPYRLFNVEINGNSATYNVEILYTN